ncbi:hypothetical protein Tco_0949089 [Tanacetum coccineum]
MTDEEETNDKFVHGDEQLNNDEDEEMTNDEVEDTRKGDAKISNVAKADAEKIEEIKDDSKKAEVPPISSSLYICSGFGDQFLKLSYDTSLSPSILIVPVLVISKSSVLTPIPETPSVALATTLLTPSFLRVVKLEKDASELNKIDHSVEALATLKSQVLMVVEHYLGSKITPESSKIQKPTIDLEQESKKSASDIRKIKREQYKKEKMPKYTIKSTDKVALKEYDQKSALYQTMHENKSFNRNPVNHALYHALMKALIKDDDYVIM